MYGLIFRFQGFSYGLLIKANILTPGYAFIP